MTFSLAKIKFIEQERSGTRLLLGVFVVFDLNQERRTDPRSATKNGFFSSTNYGRFNGLPVSPALPTTNLQSLTSVFQSPDPETSSG